MGKHKVGRKNMINHNVLENKGDKTRGNGRLTRS